MPVTWPAISVAVLGALAVLSLVAMLPLSLLARQFGNGIVAVVIGIPCAGLGVLVRRRTDRDGVRGPAQGGRRPGRRPR